MDYRDKDKIIKLLREVKRKYTLNESKKSKNLGKATIDYALNVESLNKRDEDFLRYVASSELPEARIHKVSVVNTQRQEGPNTRNQNKVSYMQYLVVVYSDTNGAFHNKKKIELGTKEISGMLEDFYGDRVDEVDEDEEEEDENVLPLPINAFVRYIFNNLKKIKGKKELNENELTILKKKYEDEKEKEKEKENKLKSLKMQYENEKEKEKKNKIENKLKSLKIQYEEEKKKKETTEDQEKDFDYVEVNGQKQFRYTDGNKLNIIRINVDLNYDDAEDGNKDKPQDKEKFMDDYNSEDEKKEKKIAELLLEEDAIPNRSTDEDYESSEESSDESSDDSNDDTSIGTSSDSDSDSD